VLKQSSGIFNNFGAVKPPLRQAAGRCAQQIGSKNLRFIFEALTKVLFFTA